MGHCEEERSYELCLIVSGYRLRLFECTDITGLLISP